MPGPFLHAVRPADPDRRCSCQQNVLESCRAADCAYAWRVSENSREDVLDYGVTLQLRGAQLTAGAIVMC